MSGWPGRGRAGGRFAGGRTGGRGCGSTSSGARGQDVCACEANAPLVTELRKLDGECLQTGKQNLRHGVLRALKSVKLYPLPITTEAEACQLSGVGIFIARRMLKGLTESTAPAGNNHGEAHLDRENVAPPCSRRTQVSSSISQSKGRRGATATQQDDTPPAPNGDLDTELHCSQHHNDHFPSNNNNNSDNNKIDGAASTTQNFRRVIIPAASVSLAANLSALRGDEEGDTVAGGGLLTSDVTPRRPKSRARLAPGKDMQGNAIGGGGGATGSLPDLDTEAPRFFSGTWEAILIVDNREHECMSVQSALLQKGVPCETRQLPLGDMIWVARRLDAPAPEAMVGYIIERKTAPDLAHSILDGRYDEQKRRLKLSGLRRRIYLVEGNLSHQDKLAPTALRTALATSQACGGLAVVRCASLRDTLDFLARTHGHISSLLKRSSSPAGSTHGPTSITNPPALLFRTNPGTCPGNDARREGRCSPVTGNGNCGGQGPGPSFLRPTMTYDEYAQRCAKRAPTTTARHVLGAMVRQAPGCSAARAEAVVRAFESPLGFLLALERATVGGGSHDDDREIKVKRGEELLNGLRCSGGAGTNKLPQPLRRLLCRLFLEDSVLVPPGDVEGLRDGDDRDDDGCCDVMPLSPDSVMPTNSDSVMPTNSDSHC